MNNETVLGGHVRPVLQGGSHWNLGTMGYRKFERECQGAEVFSIFCKTGRDQYTQQ
jgi:hypothetical protein